MTERVFNFSAGPAVMPLPVLKEVQRDLVALPGVGMSILEISHRSPWFDDILAEAEENLRRILEIPSDYRVLFLQGGAQLQFSMVPINLLGPGRRAEYLLTGSWGKKAMAEAKREGDVHVAWNGKPDYVRVPRDGELDIQPGAEYLHYTSNETIEGVQFVVPPASAGAPLVCDASSDFLSASVDWERMGLLYACAQKNAGPAGMTVVVIQDQLLARRRDGLHSMLDFRAHAEAGSRLNTPPVFAIYVFLLITRWIEREMGGLAALARFNREKAEMLYRLLDDSGGFYSTHAERASRSVMNVTFRTATEDLDRELLQRADRRGLAQLKGHRSVGGMRASLYNALPQAGVEALCDFLEEFRSEHQRDPVGSARPVATAGAG